MANLRNDPSTSRGIFSGEHEQFRETVCRFVDEELVPHHAEWEKAQVVSREIWRRTGEVGIPISRAAFRKTCQRATLGGRRRISER